MLNLPLLNAKHLNLRFNFSKEHLTRVVEFPGLWMSPEELSALTQDIRAVSNAAGLSSLEYGAVKGEKETLDRSIITIIYDKKEKRALAFNALSVMNCTLQGKPQPVIHLGLVIIDPHCRAKGLSWILYGLSTLLLFLKNRCRPLWISNVTQVPAIIGTVSEGFSHVFPNPLSSSRKSYNHLQLAREIMAKHRHIFGVGMEAEFDEDNFVIKNAYTGGSDHLKKTWEQAPKHRKESVNQFAKDHLDYARGDDILQLGALDLASFYRYVVHANPKESKLVIFYKLLFAACEHALLPIFHWFSTDCQMGVLRARPRGTKND